MKSEFKYICLIERFINEDMAGLEQEKFIKELRSNKRLQHEYQEYQKIISSIKDQGAIKLRKQLVQVVNGSTQKIFLTEALLYAAIILFFVAFGVVVKLTLLSFEPKYVNLSYWHRADSLRIIFDSTKPQINNLDTIFISRPINTKDKKTIANKENVSTKEDKKTKTYSVDLSGPNYTLNPIYAELITTNYRSCTLSLIILNDSALYKTGDQIKFSWETRLKKLLFLEILNNNGGVLFETCVDDMDHILINHTFSPGIYIIKFRTDRELVNMGVFYVY